jgi:precorrin-6A/cobalt-precorrin-6A reductase
MRVLVLGGTTEASALARSLADAGLDAVFSYAGRTDAPVAQPLPLRVGGFGGVDGLCDYLRVEKITHLVDATHPFAAQMTRHAVAACDAQGVCYLALERPVWTQGEGDHWTHVADIDAAVAVLPNDPARVFLAIGKQTLAPFAAKSQHHYLLRLVDPPQDIPLPAASVVLARGPFDLAGDLALLRAHHIDVIVAKNAGGSGARAKLDAARALSLPVILIDRPQAPSRPIAATPAEVMRWLDHSADLGV